ncbi:amidohydrolase [Cryobacterium sp. TMT1-21]|uniref:amidohydrolase n=1 Tax=Cryobacterium sp. TMT1-21 TaxID=1259234 RepID=UPI001F545A4A|nr:amidohydrolase [Cryobacterium sp. TMT1-21]
MSELIAPDPALTFFIGGTAWLGAGVPEATAVLVSEGRIAALDDDARELMHQNLLSPTPATFEVVDLDGGFLMPSFGEGHAHPLFGGLEENGPSVRACTSIAEIVAEVRRYAEKHPQKEWIIGASYDGSLTPGGLFDARWLDEALSDRPVMLRAWDYHTVWCNSLALERAGIDANTPEPELGEIPRRADGSPLGILREWGAIELLTTVSPGFSFDEQIDALRRATKHFAELGVTWVQDAWVEPADVVVYLEAARRGALSTRVNLALLADPRHFPASLPALIEARRQVELLGHPLLTANSVKFFADGVVENETGALLEPYCSGLHGHGMLVWTAEHLAESVTAIDAAGFQAHIHAIGDAAVRRALDAIELARRVNGPADRRPVIAHVQLAAADDLPRFKELDVIAVMQPLWAQMDALMTVLTVPRLGLERTDRQYQMRTLVETGATLAFGSDWPCSSASPLEGIGIAVSRATIDGEPAGGWMPEQRLDAETALAAYTSGVASQAGAARTQAPWGEIRVGASADLVWLARDPRTVCPTELPLTGIRATYLAGAPTFQR